MFSIAFLKLFGLIYYFLKNSKYDSLNITKSLDKYLKEFLELKESIQNFG